ncbi:MAG: prolipoprotein diacylglyceryl transferase [Spirochaetota bacterium]
MHPVIFSVGPFEIRFYGLMYVIAIVLGIVLLRREIPRKKINLTRDDVWSYAFWCVVGGLLGARIYYVLFLWSEYYARNPLEIFAIWHGGLAIHGGILGGVAAAYLYSRSRGVKFWGLTDATAPLLALGQVFGRFGNFMNGDAHGVPTDLPWGVVFPRGTPAGNEYPGIPLHPVQLYELGLNLVSFVILWKLRKRNHKSGFILAMYLVNYGVIRFFVTFLRADSLMLDGIKAAHAISVVFVAGTMFFILRYRLWTKDSNKH